jgi:hypothetical protein
VGRVIKSCPFKDWIRMIKVYRLTAAQAVINSLLFSTAYPNSYPIDFYHATPTENVSNYDLISAKVSGTEQPNIASIDALRELIPRSDPEPFSDYFPRVGNPSPGPAIMIGALQPDPYLSAYLQQNTTYGTGYHPDSQASSASPVDDPVFVEESAPMWPHQVPETAFGLPHPNDLHPNLVPVSVSEMSRSHSISKSPSQTSTPPPCKRIGGRRYGFRLSKAGAKNARAIRQRGSCWHCFLMKIKVRYYLDSAWESNLLTLVVFSWNSM